MLPILRSNLLAFLALVPFILIQIHVNALPLRIRQNATKVQTMHTTQTIAGPMVETCVITLTPIVDKDGKPAVEEVRECTLAFTNPGAGGANGTVTTVSTEPSTVTRPTIPGVPTIISSSTASSSSKDGVTVAGASSAVARPPESTPTPSGPTSTPTPVPTSTPSPTSQSTSASSIKVNGISTVTRPQTSSSFSSDATTTTTRSEAATTSSASVTDTSTSDAASTLPPDQQASTSSTEPFEMPGKKLSVLPIGLGVFAGISVIALIVVGLVTYERTKYRKAFRQRKLAESGAVMGYGGTAERS